MPPRKTANAASPRAALPNPSISTNRKRSHRDASSDAPSTTNEPNKRVSTGSTAATNHHRHSTNTFVHLIEERPDWAFDVVGTWEIDATHFERAIDPRKFFIADFGPRRPVEPFTLEIRYDNHFKPGQASRQLWATFQWSSLRGCMRMCPSHPDQITPDHFYGMCALDKGVWPAEAPRGIPMWNLRCRVGDLGAGKMFDSDRLETKLQFHKDKYGTMRIFGKMADFTNKAQKFSGVKVSHSITELEKASTWSHLLGRRSCLTLLALGIYMACPGKGEIRMGWASSTSNKSLTAYAGCSYLGTCYPWLPFQ